MNTAVGGLEAGRKTPRMRTARRRRETRIRFWSVFAVSAFFVVALGASLYIGAVVAMGNFSGQFDAKAAASRHTAQIKRPLLDGTFCRTTVFDNTTAQTIEDKVERCARAVSPPKSKTKTQFSWGGR